MSQDLDTLFHMEQARTIREKLDALEVEMKKYPQVEMPPRHYFAKGLYAREITIPAGTLLTGKIHTTQHINIISQGDISVLTEHGPKRVQAPCTLISPPGTKRAGYAHTDTVWTTIHANPTDETDPDVMESILITPVYLVEEVMPSEPELSGPSVIQGAAHPDHADHVTIEEAVCPSLPQP